MPVYEYECPNCGKSVEREYKISEYPGTIVCDDCQSEAKLRISRTSFSLKGVGWAKDGYYRTDREMIRTKCEITSIAKIGNRAKPSTPAGIQLFR